MSSDTLSWYSRNNRTDSHALQNLERFRSITGRYYYYKYSCLIPTELFNKDYPANPKTFGEKLRKARIDAGLNTRELAERVGVTPDTVINWELRGMEPKSKNAREKVKQFIQ